MGKGPTPLGAQMDSSAVFFARLPKYCRNGDGVRRLGSARPLGPKKSRELSAGAEMGKRLFRKPIPSQSRPLDLSR
jgi:hypothetical protein